ncbi:Delta(8)-fatty-acid desaturase [Dichanthelium oligosanthes]|uniref:Delta(8)-fatty-acid desaturase n=1 Tax=Dichanthelium oligosanthes TaxID=888268 RepID=A0A1E5UUE8_9POAL|nr:Delta(8)-fatty-acid desaturase [Dichanthelium oligosanthes]
MVAVKDVADRKEFFYVTSAEMAKHSADFFVWVAVQGKVYDVIFLLPRHPGGDLPLLFFSGQDVTDAFVAYHFFSAWRVLDRYRVAIFFDYEVSDVSRDYRFFSAEFARAGLFDRNFFGCAASLCAMAALLFFAVWLVIATASVAFFLAAAVMLGFLWMRFFFLGHDSGHYVVMLFLRLNRAVQHMPLFAVSPRLFFSLTSTFYRRVMRFFSAARLLVSYQHWTFFPVMCVARVNLFALFLLLLLADTRTRVPFFSAELAGVAVFWVCFFWLVSRLPGGAAELFLFVLLSFAVTGIQFF